MSAHDTPEVGSGECICPDPGCKWDGQERPASPDPVQPAGAGEGLSDEARAAKVWHEYAHPTADELADWLLTIPRADLVKMAARFTAWGEHVTYCRAEDYRARTESAEAAVATALREKAEALTVCDRDHGHEGNPARVYGHHGSRRTCIRVKATDQWVYDPAWEARNE